MKNLIIALCLVGAFAGCTSPTSPETTTSPTPTPSTPTPTPIPPTPTPVPPTPTPSPVDDWIFCANEDDHCDFAGTMLVRYGANDQYTYGTFTDGVQCSNSSFPLDPIVGTVKECFYKEGDIVVPPTPTPAPTGPQTWYIRLDGGTRYSAKATSGQCNGLSDSAYPGTGVNQNCAFKDYRSLWDDQSYGTKAKWVISGGDTVIIRGGPYRIGFDTASGQGEKWCLGGDGPFGCINPTIPPGTADNHTKILGENYANCKTKTELFGGHGAYAVLNLADTQFVDVQCLELSRHSQCVRHGDPMFPSACSSDFPVDDYDSEGINTNQKTADIFLKDLYIHNHTDRGIIGALGGLITVRNVLISANGMGGWDMDDGQATKLINAKIDADYLTIEWSGCTEEYPKVHANPIISCYSQSSGGYGDGVGTAAGSEIDVVINHSTFRYNTQDGVDFGHVDTGSHSISITNSKAYGNSGGQFKWGGNLTKAVFENNLILGNCYRLSQPFPDTPATYNQHLSDFCRAFDTLSFNFKKGGTAIFANNTIVGYSPTLFDVDCWETDHDCSSSVFTFKNNIVLGYENKATWNAGGQPGGPGGFYYQNPTGTVDRTNNIYYGVRTISCPTGNAGESCANPLLLNQPTFSTEASLDNFDFHLSSSSPAKGAGVSIPGLSTNIDGTAVSSPPNIGAY